MPKWVSPFIQHLVPPSNHDEDAVMAWRWMIFLTVTMTAVALIAHIAFAKGVLPGYEFVLAEDFEHLVERYDQSAEATLDAQILRLRERQCYGIRDGNQAAVQLAEGRLRERRRAFRELTGVEYVMPTCEEVGVNMDDVRQ